MWRRVSGGRGRRKRGGRSGTRAEVIYILPPLVITSLEILVLRNLKLTTRMYTVMYSVLCILSELCTRYTYAISLLHLRL